MVATCPPRRTATVATVDVIDAGTEISDEELTALALAADPEAPIAADAEPWLAGAPAGLLPAWYMPAAATPVRRCGHRAVVAVVVGALLLVSGAGLCVTSGFPEIAW
jgi:hypothetical protein